MWKRTKRFTDRHGCYAFENYFLDSFEHMQKMADNLEANFELPDTRSTEQPPLLWDSMCVRGNMGFV